MALAVGASLLGCTASHERPLEGGASQDASLPGADAGLVQAMPALLPKAPSQDGGVASARSDAAPAASPGDCVARDFPITFISMRAPPAIELELYVMTQDGADVRRIGRGGHFTNPVWSPEGGRIAFHHVSPDLRSYIGVLGPDDAIGAQLTELTTYPRPSDVGDLPDGPSWSPDGETLAFAAPESTGLWRIYLMASTGAQRRALLPELAASHAHPSFARHDRRLAYVAESDSDTGSDLWVVDVDDPTRTENLTQGRVRRPEFPRWSPDDTRLAFSALDPQGTDGGPGDAKIFVLTLETGAIRQVTSDAAFDRHPTWSPDGESLVYSSQRDCPSVDDCNDLWRVRLDGSEAPRQLTTSARESYPDWYAGTACVGAR
jgi:TolB protein